MREHISKAISGCNENPFVPQYRHKTFILTICKVQCIFYIDLFFLNKWMFYHCIGTDCTYISLRYCVSIVQTENVLNAVIE